MDIDRIYDMLFQSASRIVAAGEEHQPILLVFRADEKLEVISGNRLPDKDALAALQQRLAADPQVLVVALIMEAWVMERPDPATAERLMRGDLNVSDCPERTEAIVFSLMTPTRQAFIQCPIDRTTNTLIRRPLMWLDRESEGRFVRTSKPSLH